jgi:serine/threonine-protein kinase
VTESHDVLASPNAVPDNDVDDVVKPTGPTGSDDSSDDASAEAHRRRVLHSAAIGGVIVVVLLAWFLGVRALRSASQSGDTPTNLESTSAEPTAPTASLPPRAIIAPPPLPSTSPRPVATTEASVTTRPSTAKSAPTTTAPVNSPSQATVPQTTRPTSTPPNGLDTRPAVGMPCGPDQTGASAVSNTDGPVNCVSTPGGFAWEPPGG